MTDFRALAEKYSSSSESALSEFNCYGFVENNQEVIVELDYVIEKLESNIHYAQKRSDLELVQYLQEDLEKLKELREYFYDKI